MEVVNIDGLSRQESPDAVAADLRPLFAAEMERSLRALSNQKTTKGDLKRFCRRLADAAQVFGFRQLAEFVKRSEAMLERGELPPRRFLAVIRGVQRQIASRHWAASAR